MQTIPMFDSIEPFLKFITVNGGSPNTIRAYRADLAGLQEWVVAHPDLSLDEAAAAWLTENRTRWAATTTRRKRAAVRAWAKYAGLDLLGHYRTPTPAPPEPHPIPEGIDAVKVMLSHTDDPEVRALVGLCGLLGLRVGEALTVEAHHVSSRADGWWLHVYGKGSKERDVPVSPYCATVLVSAMALHPVGPIVEMSERSARRRLIGVSKGAGYGHHASHDFRATAATAFYYNSEKDLRATQEFLGHASSKTTEVYTQPSSARIRAGADF